MEYTLLGVTYQITSIMLLGILGMALIAIAWIPQTYKTIKTKTTGMRVEFNFIYLIGSLLLAYYSVKIDDLIFIILNSLSALLALVNLPFTLREHNLRKKAAEALEEEAYEQQTPKTEEPKTEASAEEPAETKQEAP